MITQDISGRVLFSASLLKTSTLQYLAIQLNRNIIQNKMPKDIYTPRQLPREQPDRCELCPLVGIIPKDQQRKGKRERYFCLGIYEAETDEQGDPVLDQHGQQQMSFPRLSSKGITVSARKVKEGGHLLHRPCDYTWQSWMMLPGRVFGIPTDVFNAYRIPYEKEQMIKNMPKFKFRKRK